MRFLQQTHKCAEKFTLVSSIYVPLRPQNGILACVKHAECLVLYLTIIYTFTRVCESLPGRKLQQLSGSQTDLEMTDIILRVSDDAVKKVVDFVSLCPKVEVVKSVGATKRKHTDRDIHEAARRCQALMRGQASWAIFYEVLWQKYDERRSISRFERDMDAQASDLNYGCPYNTIAVKLSRSPWLRDPVETWKDTNALNLAEAFEKALNELLLQQKV